MSTKEICRVPWVRDEVILALAVVLRSQKNTYPVDSQECQELSRQLNALPIVPSDKRSSAFRNPNGMSFQLGKLARVVHKLKPVDYMGDLFGQVLIDYPITENLLNVASAILGNIDFSKEISTTYFRRTAVFKEGILLEGIHCYLENKSDAVLEDHCEICGMFPEAIYASGLSFNTILERHCLTPPEMLNRKTPLNKKNMLTVCPTCHKVLHEYRPWITPNNLSTVLQWK